MNGVKLTSLARILCFIVFRTDGEKWSRLRKALASKMLRPKDIRENLDNFNSVTRDAIERIVAIRGKDDVIPDLEGELAKYATECKLIFCQFSRMSSPIEVCARIRDPGEMGRELPPSLFFF